MANVRKHIILPATLFERVIREMERSGVKFSPMACLALDEWLRKQERKRKENK